MKMKFTIEKMKNKLEYSEGNSVISIDGYAFIDELGKCIIIVYGESRKEQMSKYLNDELHYQLNLKYKTLDLNAKI